MFNLALLFNHISIPGSTGHTLGRFRLSVTTDARDTFADGLATGGDVTANWSSLKIRSASSHLGATIAVLPDDSVIVSGPLAEIETYKIEAGTRLNGITGIRLEALQDSSLPMNGPGRERNGNFVVSELIVTARPGLAPAIEQEPSSTTVIAGNSTDLTVTAASSLPVTYQWFLNGQPLEGETNATIAIDAAEFDDAGTYTVEASNAEGSTLSLGAVLSVFPANVTNAATLRVSNEMPTNAPISDIEGELLAGPQFLAQAYVGSTSETLERTGPAVPFLNADDAGFFVPIDLVLTNVAQGSSVFVQVRVWETAGGPSYEAAVQNGAQYGASQIIETPTGGGAIPTPDLEGTIPSHQEGSQVRVPIMLTSRGEVGGGSFDLSVNRSHLVEPEIEWNMPGGSLTSFNTNSSFQGQMRASFALSGTTLSSGALQIATITFRSLSVQGTTPSALMLSSASFFGADGRELPLAGTEVKSGSVVLTRRDFIGDNNGNDRLDINDATIVMRFVSFLEQRKPWDISLNDLNKNLQLDVGDVTLVLRAVVGLDPQPTNPPPQPMFARAFNAFSAVNGRITMTVDKQKALPGEKVKVTLSLKDFSGPVSGLSFRIQYPATALRLENSTAHRTGLLVPGDAMAIWNVAPSQNHYAAQNGTVMVAMMSARSWSTNSGEIAELIFTVQEGAGDQYRWPISVSQAEVSSGFELVGISGAELFYFGRDAAASQFEEAITFSDEGLSLGIRTEVGLSYRIEVSEDLRTWELLTTVEGTGVAVSVTDADAEKTGQRFYRAIQVP